MDRQGQFGHFWKGNYEAVSADVRKIDWEKEIYTDDLYTAWDKIEKTINDLIKKHIPKQNLNNRKPKKKACISKETINAMADRSVC